MNLKELHERIDRETENILPRLLEFRRELHRYPELRFEEKQTSARIRDFLSGLDLELNPPFLGTDITGVLRAGGDGRPQDSPPAVILRADMDALPLEDGSGSDSRSRHPGRAHACGHDGHMAVLAGTIEVLHRLRDAAPGGLGGGVGFIFQPAEEEGVGAAKLIKAGLFRKGVFAGLQGSAGAGRSTPPVFALHAWPGMPAGTFAAKPGPYMAAADRFTITISGPGGHGAMPHTAADPVVTAAQLILALQTIVSRRVDPMEPAVVTVGSVRGGEADNVIPEHVVVKGTVRSFDSGVQKLIKQGIEEITAGICGAFGCSWECSYGEGYPVVVNDTGAAEAARETAESLFGTGGWFTGDTPSMGAEDFACYLEHLPGAVIRLGMGEESPSLHAPDFEFKEEALKPAVAFMCALSARFLNMEGLGFRTLTERMYRDYNNIVGICDYN